MVLSVVAVSAVGAHAISAELLYCVVEPSGRSPLVHAIASDTAYGTYPARKRIAEDIEDDISQRTARRLALSS
jgi:hypothetical protein